MEKPILILKRDELKAGILRRYIGKTIQIKFINTIGYREGILEDVSGRTREFNDGRDWVPYKYVSYIKIYL